METNRLTAVIAECEDANISLNNNTLSEIEEFAAVKRYRSRLRNSFWNNRFVWLSFGIPLLILLMIYIVHGIFPFGENSVLRIDLYHQYVPFFEELLNKIKSGESLAYSFNIGMGQNFVGNIINYLLSPFSIIVLIFGEKYVTEAIALIITLKCACASASFCWYLKKSKEKQGYITVAFSLLYAFSSYFTAYYWNVMWMDAMYLFPLVMLGVENIQNSGKWKLYMFSLSATLITNYYIAFMICLFSIIYFLFYFISNNRFFTKAGAKKFLRSSVQYGFCSLAAAGLAAVVLIPMAASLTSSSATNSSFPSVVKFYFNGLEFLAGLLPGVEPTIRSSAELVTPNIYCGALIVFFLPLYVMSKKIKLKEKICSIAVLVLMFFSFDINMLNYIWHAFHFPNDLPYRQSFVFIFMLLIMCYNVVMNIGEFNNTKLLVSGVICLAFVAVCAVFGVDNVNIGTVIFSVVALVSYMVVSIAFTKETDHSIARLLSILCLVLVSVEMLIQNACYWQSSQSKTNYYKDYDDVHEAIEGINLSDNGFYRIEKAESKTRNDPALYGYCGISGFSSLSYETTSKLMRKIGVFGNNLNSYTYYPTTPALSSIFSLKYIMSEEKMDDSSLYEKQGQYGDIEVYEYKYYLPLLIETAGNLADFKTSESNPFVLQMDLLKTMSGNSKANSIYRAVENVSIAGEGAEIISYHQSYGLIDYSRDEESEEASIIVTMVPETTQHIYVYTSSSHVEMINITGNDDDDESYETKRPFIIDLGICEEGVPVEITLDLKNDNGSIAYFYAYSLSYDDFQSVYDSMNGDCEITRVDSTTVEAIVNAEKSGEYFVSIPYDSGWKLLIDGEEVEIASVVDDSFISFKTDKGQHKIVFTYHVKGLKVGTIVTLISVIAITIPLIISYRKRRTKEICK